MRKPFLRLALGLFLLSLSAVLVFRWWDERSLDTAQSILGQPLPHPLERQPRSLLLITIDTTRPDHLQPYGATNVETPTLQHLADQGIVMEQVQSVAPLTLPAHTSILTGLYPPQHGVRNNGTHYVDDKLVTLAEIAHRASRRTAAFVSAAVLEKRYGLTQGFELYDDDLSTGVARAPRMVPDRPAAATVDAARAWLDTVGADETFFAWVHFYDPHAAYNPPKSFREAYQGRPYDGEIAYMDQEIGRLLDHPRLRSDQDLVISVVGDHGESLGEHGEKTHGLLAYQATLHVAWLLKVGSLLEDGPLRVPQLVSQVDVLPTLAFAAGLHIPRGISGRNLFDPTAAEPRPTYSESYLPYYTYGWSKIKVIRQGAKELVNSSRSEFYDLLRDPRELSNLFQEQAHEAHDLGQVLLEMNQRFGTDGELEQQLAIDQESIAKLQALGYVATGSRPDIEEDRRPNPADVVHIHVGLERGRQFLQSKLWELAAEQFKQVLSDDPNNIAAMLDLAEALQRSKDLDQAVGILEGALELDPQNQRTLLQLARTERLRGHPQKALELIDTAASLDERNSAVWFQKASYFVSRGDWEQVELALRKGLTFDPEDGQLNALFAYYVESKQSMNGATERLERVVATDPFLAVGWRLLGTLQEKNGSATAAATSYRRGLQRSPDDAGLLARLGILLAREEAPEATPILREAIRLSELERPAELYLALGAQLANQGSVEAAIQQYDRILDNYPRHPAALNNRAVAIAQLGRIEEALTDLEALCEEQPNYADAHNNLASVAVFAGKWKLAKNAARQALALDDSLAEAWDSLGRAEDGLGNTDSAAEAYRRADLARKQQDPPSGGAPQPAALLPTEQNGSKK